MKKKVNRNPQLKFSEYASKSAELEEVMARRNNEIRIIKERYETQIDRLKQEKQTIFDEIQLWAMMNSKDFEKTKSQVHAFGVVGFRKGQPKLDVEDGVNMDDVLQQLQEDLHYDFLRTNTTLDKNAIKKALKEGPDKEMLEGLGLKIVQDESFYIDLTK